MEKAQLKINCNEGNDESGRICLHPKEKGHYTAPVRFFFFALNVLIHCEDITDRKDAVELFILDCKVCVETRFALIKRLNL